MAWVSSAQRYIVELHRWLLRADVRIGRRYVHWVSYPAESGETVREYYFWRGQARRRAEEIARRRLSSAAAPRRT